MYRPLYWFGSNGQVRLNGSLSLADAPVYARDGKSLSITLKGWKWSNGDQITARALCQIVHSGGDLRYTSREPERSTPGVSAPQCRHFKRHDVLVRWCSHS